MIGIANADGRKRCRPQGNDDGPPAGARSFAAMAMRSDHKALLFLGAVAVLGAGVRVVRASGRGTNGAQPALERQAQAADSAARAGRGAPRSKGKTSGSGAKTGKRDSKRGSSTARGGGGGVGTQDVPRARSASGPLDHPGYIAGRLDLDVATAAQIDSLPGVGPAMARRIVLDRMARGPYVTRDGLRRVPGTGPVFLSRIDSLVTFSGAVKHHTPADTASARKRARTR